MREHSAWRPLMLSRAGRNATFKWISIPAVCLLKQVHHDRIQTHTADTPLTTNTHIHTHTQHTHNNISTHY